MVRYLRDRLSPLKGVSPRPVLDEFIKFMLYSISESILHMKYILSLVLLCCMLICCNTPVPEQRAIRKGTDSVAGKVELYDSSLTHLIDTTAIIEVIGRHYKWSEGPVWVPSRHMLLFSAVKENTIYRWSGTDTPLAYLTPSGYTDT